MKNTLIALAVLALSSAAQANDAVNTSTFTNGVTSYSGAMAGTNGAGTSRSSASNTQFAVNQGTSGATFTPDSASGFANGVGVTGSRSTVSNVSTGSGVGAAAATGTSLVNQSTGVTFVNGTAGGSVIGTLSSVAQTGVETGTNGTASARGVNTVNYNGTGIGVQTLTNDFVLTNSANTTGHATSVTTSTNTATGTGAASFTNNVAGMAAVDATAHIGDATSSTPL